MESTSSFRVTARDAARFVKLSWGAETKVGEVITAALKDAARIPGLVLHPLALRIPENALHLPEVRRLWELTGTTLKRESRIVPNLWKPERRLYAHQKVGAEFLLRNAGGLLADGMGLGKTAAAIAAAETMAQNAGDDRARLIIGPLFTREVWRQELFTLGAIANEDDFVALVSLNYNDASFEAAKRARWIFVHYDVVGAWWSKIYTGLRARRPVVAIADEIHWIRNGRARRSKATRIALTTCPNRIGLTGTPIANHPVDLWHPLHALTGGFGGPVDFRRRYCGAVHNGFGYEDHGPSHVEELNERLRAIYLRRTIQDAGIDLPPLSRSRIEVDLDNVAREHHDRLLAGVDLKELVRAVMDGRAGKDTIRLLGELRKVTSASKLRETRSYVTDVLEQGESVVVFTWERRTAEHLAKAIASVVTHPEDGRIVGCVHGGYPQDVRDNVVRTFQAHGGLLVATLDSLREGVTLHRARLIVLHDLDWTPSSILQAEARVHRLGQTRGCVSTWVVARDSIDTLIARVLLLKAEQLEKTLGLSAMAEAADELDLRSIAPDVEHRFDDLLARWRAA